MHGKLSLGESIVQKTIDLLSATNSKDPQLKELKNSLMALKLKDIEVDINSTQVQLFGEISALRTSILQGNSPNIEGLSDRDAMLKEKETMDTTIKALEQKLRDSESKTKCLHDEMEALKKAPTNAAANPGTNTELESQIADLKSEVQALKIQLVSKEDMEKSHASEVNSLKSEIQVLKAEKGTKADVVAANNGQIVALQTELQNAKSELSSKSKQLNEKDAVIASNLASISELNKAKDLSMKESNSKNNEIDKLKATNKQLQEKLAATIVECEAKITQSSASLVQQNKQKVAEIEAKLESEKEEMMEAMAQEIEVWLKLRIIRMLIVYALCCILWYRKSNQRSLLKSIL